MQIDFNEIIISGIINNIKDSNNEYIKFGLTTTRFDNKKIFVSLNINRDLYEIYKDFFVVGKNVFIKGYLNSYIMNNKIQNFITVNDMSNNLNDLKNDKKKPHFRFDSDGVMVWNGKRCEKEEITEDERKELEKIFEL